MSLRVASLSVVLLGMSFVAGSLQAAPGDVLASFPTPGRRGTALTFDGEHLWLADRESDLLYEIDPHNGQVVRSLEAPGFQVEGLATEGDFLWVLDAESERAFQLDPATGIAERTIQVRVDSPQGLAFDGRHLWVADLKQDRIYQISTEDGTTISQIPSPSNDPQGLAFDGKYLWVSDRSDDMIYMVHPDNGAVIVAFPSPSKFPRGMAFDGKTLWNVDYQSDTIYKIVRQDDAIHTVVASKRETLDLVHQVRNYGPGRLVSGDLYLAVPRDLLTQKLLEEPTFEPQPTDFVCDQWGQKLAHWHYDDVAAGRFLTATMHVDVELRKVRYFLFPERSGTPKDVPEEIRQRYLCDGSKFQIDDPVIRDTVGSVVGKETNSYWIARKLFDHVAKEIRYERTGGWNLAPTVLERGSGSCSEFSFVFIALCRGAGLPARYVGSAVIRGDDASTDAGVFHRWPEVYLPNYGWVPMDPSRGPAILERPANAADVIGFRDYRYLITTIGGGPSEFLQWNYNSNAFWRSKGPCKVETERYAEWAPLGRTQVESELP